MPFHAHDGGELLRGSSTPDAYARGTTTEFALGGRDFPMSAIVTIIVGVTSAAPASGRPDQLIKVADEVLYEAKRGSRNQVAAG
jgi:GGDEF domain-containing protein